MQHHGLKELDVPRGFIQHRRTGPLREPHAARLPFATSRDGALSGFLLVCSHPAVAHSSFENGVQNGANCWPIQANILAYGACRLKYRRYDRSSTAVADFFVRIPVFWYSLLRFKASFKRGVWGLRER